MQPELETLVFNGLDGASGGYLLPAMTPREVSALALGETLDAQAQEELAQRVHDLHNPHAGVEADQRDLAETGWGVILAHDAPEALIDALQPLIQLRRQQAGERFKQYTRGDGYRPGETKNDFLTRHGVGPGPVVPDKVPYYLLIVGGPEKIPYRFQYQMDVQYAVGRLAFDSLEDYARYAQSAVQAEKNLRLAPRAAFFGAANPDDRATTMSAEHLVAPLAEAIRARAPQWAAKSGGKAAEWQVQTVLREAATKSALRDLLEGGQAPALFFSASHGIAFPNGDPRQLPHQGALVCQDWPGPQLWREPIPADHYFSAEDLSDSANLLGTLAFFFACYGAGTPQEDEFAHQLWSGQPEKRLIAPHDFVARLPQRMMTLPRGGALAVVGHVERAWGASFYWGKAGAQTQVFQDCFERLLKGGYPIGYAVEVFNNRYAELSTDLTEQVREVRDYFKKPNEVELANLWTANNDARNYIVLGDPAARLYVSSGEGEARPEMPPVVLAAQPAAAPEAAQPPAAIQPAPPGEALDYGLLDSFKQVQSGLGASLQDFVGKLSAFLSKALDEASSLEIATYVSEDMSAVRYEGGRFEGARLRALTRIEIDGDTLVCVPETDGEVDTALWKVHADMVAQAQASRAELVRAVISAAGGMVNLLKP
ncbi:MAG: C25 family cysteine peptidase [Chloroflexi bacterium]|nr:C25 family cysteine peptidase [Chloroflexota bacterium]